MSTDNMNRSNERSVVGTSNVNSGSSAHAASSDTLISEESVSFLQPISGVKVRLLSWLGLGALSIAALVVIFILPSVVEKYELPLVPRLDLTETIASSPIASSSSISPFQEAQISKSRREAQDKLAILLENQSVLENVEVEQWAQQSYLDSIGVAADGDEFYRVQNFAEATMAYARAGEQMRLMIEMLPGVLIEQLSLGKSAINENRSSDAIRHYSLALLLQESGFEGLDALELQQSPEIGLRRAQVIDEVVALTKSARQLYRSEQFESAAAAFKEALALDGYSDEARKGLLDTEVAIKEDEFASIMSEGYRLLEAGESSQAIEKFRMAGELGINANEAKIAVVQTENAIASSEIKRLRVDAELAVQQELWTDASNFYEEALAIDSNLSFATEGLDYATKRVRLDVLLIQALDNPERLAENSVYDETMEIYLIGRAVEQTGPRLAKMLNQLETTLEQSQIPIEVIFRSNNMTEVTLQRIEIFGNFTEISKGLKPGRYVAVGKRAGYRDVREEFTVGFEMTPAIVMVSCDEPINALRR
ncbi:MAG: hypothetical protein P8P42_01595 [Gammaproteobacteria bacterium]|nr:hypothetical protein [Gammaproteobacteria bacterium]MDG1952906.1 hypothetical protein [Gammaproteobacteria bacterium]MDG2118975.1 hypothetical protein [Gammaproteobacteria bacterium]